MKKIIAATVALSFLASAGLASAAPAPQRHDDHRMEQRHDNNNFERRADKHYKANRYTPPRGYKTKQFHRGERLPAAYRGNAYKVDYNRYHLQAPPRGYEYVRVGNDVVLTAAATGLITGVILSLFQ